MSRRVLDASLALSWLLPDERSAALHSVREQFFTGGGVWVAAHWRLEVCNALWMAERRKRLDAPGVTRAVTLVTQLPVLVDDETNSRAGADTLALARRHAISVYDAAYLELALRLNLPLATTDPALTRAANSAAVPIFTP